MQSIRREVEFRVPKRERDAAPAEGESRLTSEPRDVAGQLPHEGRGVPTEQAVDDALVADGADQAVECALVCHLTSQRQISTAQRVAGPGRWWQRVGTGENATLIRRAPVARS